MKRLVDDAYYKVGSTGMYTLIKVNNFIIFRRALSSISVLVSMC